MADNAILQRLIAGNLVITGDIPLAYEVIGKGGHAISQWGDCYTQDNIKERLNMPDFMDPLCGIDPGGLSALNSRDIQTFANQLDKFLTQQGKSKPCKN